VKSPASRAPHSAQAPARLRCCRPCSTTRAALRSMFSQLVWKIDQASRRGGRVRVFGRLFGRVGASGGRVSCARWGCWQRFCRSWAKLRAPYSCVNPLWDTGLRENAVVDGSWMGGILGLWRWDFNGLWWLRLASWPLRLPRVGARGRSAGRGAAAHRGAGLRSPLPGARWRRDERIRCPHWSGVPASYRTWALIAPGGFWGVVTEHGHASVALPPAIGVAAAATSCYIPPLWSSGARRSPSTGGSMTFAAKPL
jgi:hypothetical protein